MPLVKRLLICVCSVVQSAKNEPNIPFLSNSSIIFKNMSSLVASLPHQIPSIPDKIITWSGMRVKKDILSI